MFVEAFAEIWAEKGIRDPLPLLTFLVVGKRQVIYLSPRVEADMFHLHSHHIRFMPQQSQ